MIRDNFEKDRPFLEEYYRKAPFSTESGIPIEELKKRCADIESRLDGEPRIKIKSSIIAEILKSARLCATPCDIFPCKLEHVDILYDLRIKWKKQLNATLMADSLAKHKPLQDVLLYKGDLDYSHTSPDWRSILSLGVNGLTERLKYYSSRAELTDDQKVYYESVITVYEAIKIYMKRLAAESRRCADGIAGDMIAADTLDALTERAPETLYEAMMLTVIFYYTQNYLDCSYVRSLGGLDSLYLPFYRADIESGRYTKEELIKLIKYFFIKIFAFGNKNNIPFYICGTDENGEPVENELSMLLLEVYDTLNIHDPKIQIRCNKKTSAKLLTKAAEMIAHGNNSIVFLNDAVVIKSLMSLGQSYAEAADYAPIGCYEPASNSRELPCTCSGRINLGKVIELTVHRGRDTRLGQPLLPLSGDSADFEGFYALFKEALRLSVEGCVSIINDFEQYYPIINQSPIFSGTFESSVRDGKDIYAGGAKYENTSICVFGLATAVDSLLAVKYAVYGEKRITLDGFSELLFDNWNGNASLAMRCKNKYPKYGNGNAEADALAADIITYAASLINGRSNGRGGVYRMGGFSIDWIYKHGRKTGATPDGRTAGEPISKNLSATLGADKNGVTALIGSVLALDHTLYPDGAVLDIVLHRSAVSGKDGSGALHGLLGAFLASGGGAIQFNVLDPDVLRRAQISPEEYKSLQIRLCGWNVYFVDLSKKEQDEFILNSENGG